MASLPKAQRGEDTDLGGCNPYMDPYCRTPMMGTVGIQPHPMPAFSPGSPQFDFIVAQVAHFFVGFSAPLVANVIWPNNTKAPYYGAAFIGGVALVKELTFDQYVEGAPFIWDGAIDLSFYLLGAAAGLFVVSMAPKIRKAAPLPNPNIPIETSYRGLI